MARRLLLVPAQQHATPAMKVLTNALPFSLRKSLSSANEEQEARDRLRIRLLTILAVMLLALVLLRSSGNTSEEQDMAPRVLSADEAATRANKNSQSSEAFPGSHGSDIPTQDGDGVTLYVPYATGVSSLDVKGLLFFSTKPSWDISSAPVPIIIGALRMTVKTRGGQNTNPSGPDISGGFWPLPLPNWGAGSPGNSQSSMEFAAGNGTGSGYNPTSDDPGNYPGPDNGDRGEGFDGTWPGSNPSFVKQQDPPQAVPEPGTLTLLASSLLSLSFVFKNRVKNRKLESSKPDQNKRSKVRLLRELAQYLPLCMARIERALQ